MVRIPAAPVAQCLPCPSTPPPQLFSAPSRCLWLLLLFLCTCCFTKCLRVVHIAGNRSASLAPPAPLVAPARRVLCAEAVIHEMGTMLPPSWVCFLCLDPLCLLPLYPFPPIQGSVDCDPWAVYKYHLLGSGHTRSFLYCLWLPCAARTAVSSCGGGHTVHKA